MPVLAVSGSPLSELAHDIARIDHEVIFAVLPSAFAIRLLVG